MTGSPELLALRRALEVCQDHAAVLREDLEEMARREWTAEDLCALSSEDRRLLDQFAYRFTRLQDHMGSRLMAALLQALGEDASALPMIDRLARLEQIGWLPSAGEWRTLRQIRNEFAHDYPDAPEERLARLELAASAGRRAVELLETLAAKATERFPAAGP